MKYPELLKDNSGKVYIAPNCYSMVRLSTGKTMNRPEHGMTKIEQGEVLLLLWEGKLKVLV